MKHLPFLISLCLFNLISAQSQLEIEGDSLNSDTILKISSVQGTNHDFVSIFVKSTPTPGRGIAATFYGGSLALLAESNQHTAIQALSNLSYGLRGISTTGYGGYFKGGNGSLVLAGSEFEFGSGQDEGVISSDPLLNSSDLWLSANDNIVFVLDHDDDEADSDLQIKNGNSEFIFFAKEGGDIKTGHEFQNSTLPNKNLLPLCYGYVIDDSLVFSSNNFTISKPAAIGPVHVDITGHEFNNTDYIVIVKALEEKDNIFTSWDTTNDNLLEIYVQERLGQFPPYIYADRDFQLIVFKP